MARSKEASEVRGPCNAYLLGAGAKRNNSLGLDKVIASLSLPTKASKYCIDTLAMAVRGYIYDDTRNRSWINKSLNNATERDTLAFDAPFVRHVNVHVRSTYPRTRVLL